jgi:adenylate cyclase
MHQSAKILVVDDNPTNGKLLVDLLDNHGYKTSTARSADEAWDQLLCHRPDLVLMEGVMPKLSGYELCKRIRDNREFVCLPIVMITAVGANQERVRGLEAGADDFLSRPINQTELLARVRSLLRVKNLQEKVDLQASQLAEWTKRLEQRVQDEVLQLERLERLKRFPSPQLAQLTMSTGGEGPAPESSTRNHSRFYGSAQIHILRETIRTRVFHGRVA